MRVWPLLIFGSVCERSRSQSFNMYTQISTHIYQMAFACFETQLSTSTQFSNADSSQLNYPLCHIFIIQHYVCTSCNIYFYNMKMFIGESLVPINQNFLSNNPLHECERGYVYVSFGMSCLKNIISILNHCFTLI